jgi:hypothetical protein
MENTTKSDADKIIDLIEELESIKTKYILKSKANKSLFENVCILIDKTIGYIYK